MAVSKELLKMFLEESKDLNTTVQHLNQAFELLGAENQIWDIVPDSYKEMVWKLLQLTPEQSDWLSWWMYENSTGVSDATGVMDLEDFDDFYAFVFEHKTVSEIQCAKSDSIPG